MSQGMGRAQELAMLQDTGKREKGRTEQENRKMVAALGHIASS